MPDQSVGTDSTIADLIPHAGSMVLLDEILEYDMASIRCRARFRPDEHHPLAIDARLPATALAEYGAQAMAVHGGLLEPAGTPPRPGRLVALGQLDLDIEELTEDTDLEIHATRSSGDRAGQIYQFSVHSQKRLLARGQATVMFIDPPESS
jgi:predicted hotdog family 3-hydroxylacyl-ACP dehydratase